MDRIPHHKECWEENGGCTTYGCHATVNSGEGSTGTADVGNNSFTVDILDIELGKSQRNSEANGSSSSAPVLHESAAGFVSFVGCVVIAFIYLLQIDIIHHEFVLLSSLIALTVGFVGLFEKNRKHSFAVLGIIFAIFLSAVSVNNLSTSSAEGRGSESVTNNVNILVPGDYLTIQEAIDNASAGDVIVVSEGIYTENIDFRGKNVTLQSEDPDNPEVIANTVIDGSNNGTVVSFKSGENNTAKLDGFTITGGSGFRQQYRITSYSGSRLSFDRVYGGGVLITGNSSPVIINNYITNNTTRNISSDVLGVGAGIAVLDSSSPTIENNTINGNYSGGHGGGIAVWYNSSPRINNNIIDNNHADDIGGGILVAMMCAPEILDNKISRNTSGNWSGGIYIAHMSGGIISGNVIDNNKAITGGGIFIRRTDAVRVKNNEFINNEAKRNGGALYLDDRATAVVEENIFNNNLAHSGGAIWVDSDSRANISSPDNNSYKNNRPNNIYRK